jgi:hypothetical protein
MEGGDPNHICKEHSAEMHIKLKGRDGLDERQVSLHVGIFSGAGQFPQLPVVT